MADTEKEALFEETANESEQINEEIPDEKTKAFTAVSDVTAGKEPQSEDPDDRDAQPFSLDDMEALLKSVGLGGDEKPQDNHAEESEDEIKEYLPKNAEMEELGQTKVLSKGEAEKTDKEPVTGQTRHYNIGKLFSKEKNRPKAKTSADGQLILDGYKEDLPENVNEAEIEASLKTKRKRFVDNFRVLAKPTQDKPILERISQSGEVRTLADSVVSEEGKNLFDAVDKANKKLSEKIAKQAAQREKAKQNAEKSKNMKKALKESVKKRTVRFEILIALTAVALILSVISAAYNPDGALEFLFGNGARVYSAVNLVLLAAGAVVSFDIFKNAVADIKSYKFTGRICTALISVFAAVQGIVSLGLGMSEETGFRLYAAFGLFIMGAQTYSQLVCERTLFRNLSVMTRFESLVGLHKVDNKSDADVLAKQISRNDYPVIYYSADAAVPENPLEISQGGTLDARYFSFCTLGVMVASLILSVTVGVIQKTPSLIASCFTGCMCLCVPVLAGLTGELLHAKQVSSISSYGGVITGMEACEEMEQANAFVFDSGDVFEARVAKFRVVPKSLIAQSDAVIFAAATLKNTRSLLAESFDDYLRENRISLPETENVQYEDGLGYSSWVAGRRVLVGNREMLVAHSITCPSEEEEERYSKGRSVMYVVVEGIIVATFLVSYSVKTEVRKSVAAFKDTGLIIMFCGSDPCLTETLAASKLGVDAASVKLVTSPGSEIISAYKEHSADRVDNGLLCSKEKKNVLALASAAHSLCTARQTARVIYIIGVVLNFAFLAFCSFMSISTSFAPLSIMVIHLLWCAVSYYIGKSRLR